VAVFGDSVLDMRGSRPADTEVGVSALALFGDVKVLAPENSAVELTGVRLFGDNGSNVPAASASTAERCSFGSRAWPCSATSR